MFACACELAWWWTAPIIPKPGNYWVVLLPIIFDGLADLCSATAALTDQMASR